MLSSVSWSVDQTSGSILSVSVSQRSDSGGWEKIFVSADHRLHPHGETPWFYLQQMKLLLLHCFRFWKVFPSLLFWMQWVSFRLNNWNFMLCIELVFPEGEVQGTAYKVWDILAQNASNHVFRYMTWLQVTGLTAPCTVISVAVQEGSLCWTSVLLHGSVVNVITWSAVCWFTQYNTWSMTHPLLIKV